MKRCATFSCLLLTLGFSLAAIAQSNDWPYSQPLQVICGIELGCANVNVGAPWNQPVDGVGDFTSAGYPVSFVFETGNPLTWERGDGFYDATFGYGGSFILQGPEGTFNGVITWAHATENDEFQSAGIDFAFEGRWSGDGKYYAGTADSFYIVDSINGPYAEADITMSTTPEPGSFLLLVSGIAGAFGWKKLRG